MCGEERGGGGGDTRAELNLDSTTPGCCINLVTLSSCQIRVEGKKILSLPLMNAWEFSYVCVCALIKSGTWWAFLENCSLVTFIKLLVIERWYLFLCRLLCSECISYMIKVRVTSVCFSHYSSVSPSSTDLQSTNRSSIFSGHHGQLALSAVFLDEYRDRLFLGGKDVMYSLMLGPISSESKEVRWWRKQKQPGGLWFTVWRMIAAGFQLFLEFPLSLALHRFLQHCKGIITETDTSILLSSESVFHYILYTRYNNIFGNVF